MQSVQSLRGGLQSVQSLRGGLQSVQPLRRWRRIGQSEMCGAALANSVGLQSLCGREGVQSLQPVQSLCGGGVQSLQSLCGGVQSLQSLRGGVQSVQPLRGGLQPVQSLCSGV